VGLDSFSDPQFSVLMDMGSLMSAVIDNRNSTLYPYRRELESYQARYRKQHGARLSPSEYHNKRLGLRNRRLSPRTYGAAASYQAAWRRHHASP
jgi:hypothetical protein